MEDALTRVEANAPSCPIPAPLRSRALRYVFATAGLASFAVGAVGVFVPGLPTTVFLLAGSYCLTRSCPWLEQRIVNSALFRPYARYLSPGTPMPWRAKVIAIAMMLSAIAVSAVVLHARGALAPWAAASLAACAVVATIAIVRFRSNARTHSRREHA